MKYTILHLKNKNQKIELPYINRIMKGINIKENTLLEVNWKGGISFYKKETDNYNPEIVFLDNYEDAINRNLSTIYRPKKYKDFIEMEEVKKIEKVAIFKKVSNQKYTEKDLVACEYKKFLTYINAFLNNIKIKDNVKILIEDNGQIILEKNHIQKILFGNFCSLIEDRKYWDNLEDYKDFIELDYKEVECINYEI